MSHQLINKLANEYTKDVVRNPDGKIFDHIQAMVEGVPQMVRAVNSHERLMVAARDYIDAVVRQYGQSPYLDKWRDALEAEITEPVKS